MKVCRKFFAYGGAPCTASVALILLMVHEAIHTADSPPALSAAENVERSYPTKDQST
jgi:hypothetical protein